MSRNVIVMDTEATPIEPMEQVNASNMLVYDFGWQVTNRENNVLERRSFVCAEIFLGEKELMKSAYYAEKIPKYWEKIKRGEAILTSYYNIRKTFIDDVEKYNVKDIYAFNMWFDFKATNATAKWVSEKKYNRFFPYNCEVCDIMKMCHDVVYKTPTYIKFCEQNGFMTKHKTPRPQYKAETYYRYILSDTEFMESHTALEDATIESVIMAYCFAKHKSMRRYLLTK